jgi:hypothetical protein
VTTSKNFVKLVEFPSELSTLKTVVVSDFEVVLDEETKKKISAKVKQVDWRFAFG